MKNPAITVAGANHEPQSLASKQRIRWALPVALAFFLGLSFFLLLASVHANQGHFIYVLDDAYIHMAISKHWACQGVFGITAHGFTPATSSPLWVGLLAALFRVCGVREPALLVINYFCSAGLLIFCAGLLRKYIISEIAVLAGLLGCISLMPLMPMLFSGMEHILQALLVLALSCVANQVLAMPRDHVCSRHTLGLWLLGILAVATRYESLFVVLVAGGFLVLRKRWVAAVGLVGLATLPVLLMGAYAVQHGGFWLPNSLMTKGEFPRFDSLVNIYLALGGRALVKLVWVAPHLLGVALLVIMLFLVRWYQTRTLAVPDWLGLIFLPVLLLHCQFAQTGWFYRYEAYLMIFGLMTAFLLGGKFLRTFPSWRTAAGILVATLCLFPGLKRGGLALRQTVPAMQNVYQQHYQMALFLKTFYDRQSIVINDVGAICFLTDIRCLDIGGLVNTEIVGMLYRRTWTPERLQELIATRKVRIGLVYSALLPGPMRDWILVATWRIKGNVVCACDTVSIYAMNAAEVPYLQKALRLFAIEQRVPVQETRAADLLGALKKKTR